MNNSQDKGFRFPKGTRDRNNQKQHHIFSAGGKICRKEPFDLAPSCWGSYCYFY
jgi:hypothetical protein